MLWIHQNKVLEVIKQTTITLMTASWHVVAMLLTVSRMSKVDYQNNVLPQFLIIMSNTNDKTIHFDIMKLGCSRNVTINFR